jgi:hypothetical protein
MMLEYVAIISLLIQKCQDIRRNNQVKQHLFA